jgi:putative membrane protein insertion efficiency factor
MTNDEWSGDNSHAIRHSTFVIRALALAIRGYQLTISPAQVFLFGPAGGCRFTPTCSQYAMDAVQEHGALAGGALAAKRIYRCHPWGGCGHDPVPKAEVGSEKIEDRIVLGNARWI